jgi:hypothetical protein
MFLTKKRRAQHPIEDSNSNDVEIVLERFKGVPGEEHLLDELNQTAEDFYTLDARLDNIERGGRLTDYSTMEEEAYCFASGEISIL